MLLVRSMRTLAVRQWLLRALVITSCSTRRVASPPSGVVVVPCQRRSSRLLPTRRLRVVLLVASGFYLLTWTALLCRRTVDPLLRACLVRVVCRVRRSPTSWSRRVRVTLRLLQKRGSSRNCTTLIPRRSLTLCRRSRGSSNCPMKCWRTWTSWSRKSMVVSCMTCPWWKSLRCFRVMGPALICSVC